MDGKGLSLMDIATMPARCFTQFTDGIKKEFIILTMREDFYHKYKEDLGFI